MGTFGDFRDLGICLIDLILGNLVHHVIFVVVLPLDLFANRN